jgi:hypothetical protein
MTRAVNFDLQLKVFRPKHQLCYFEQLQTQIIHSTDRKEVLDIRAHVQTVSTEDFDCPKPDVSNEQVLRYHALLKTTFMHCIVYIKSHTNVDFYAFRHPPMPSSGNSVLL